MSTPILVIRASRLSNYLLLISAAGFVAGGVFLVAVGSGAHVWVGWTTIVFFGAGIPLLVREIFNAKPRVVLDEIGIFDRTLGVGTIPWSEIESSYLKSTQGNGFICLVLRNPEQWVSKLSSTQRAMVKVNKKLGFQALNINLSGTAVEPALVLDVVLKKCSEHGKNDH